MKDSFFPELFLKHLLGTNPGGFLDVCWVFLTCFVFSCSPPQKKKKEKKACTSLWDLN